MIDLLALLRRPGARLVRNEHWQLNEWNQWNSYQVFLADGSWIAVDPRIAIVADRKGLAKVDRAA